jgi:hypothetical protein
VRLGGGGGWLRRRLCSGGRGWLCRWLGAHAARPAPGSESGRGGGFARLEAIARAAAARTLRRSAWPRERSAALASYRWWPK